MQTYRVSLDKKQRLRVPQQLLEESGLAAGEELVAYRDGAGRVVLAVRSALLPHVQSVFRQAREDGGQGGGGEDPVEALRAERTADTQREEADLAERSTLSEPGRRKGGAEQDEAPGERQGRPARRRAVSSSRPVDDGPAAAGDAGASVGGLDTRAVRQWAREQGLAVSDRGRLPANVVQQYRAAAR